MTEYTYQEKPKTVKAVQWDGNLETLPAIADLTKEVNTGYYPGGEWESLVLSQGCMGVKLVITSAGTDYHVPRGCYVVVDGGKLSVLPKSEFESKYQKAEPIWGDRRSNLGDSVPTQEKARETARKLRSSVDNAIWKEWEDAVRHATPGPIYNMPTGRLI